METLNSVSFGEYKKANNITGVEPTVKRSKGNGLYVTFITSDKHAEGPYAGKAKTISTWFSKRAVEKGLVSEGQSVADLGLNEMIVVDTENEAGEARQKLAFAGESKYIAI
jgi:hypothetical protein